MRLSHLICAFVGALASICAACAIPANASATATCSLSYSYAGLAASSRSHGISAVLSPMAAPEVVKGHVAGWVGVGGDGFGPGGSSEWIQVGLSAVPGSVSSIYYEVKQPDSAAKYVQLQTNIAPGELHRVAVLEVHGRPSVWRVWTDGHAVSRPYWLPGSHVGWKPQATAESWNDNAHVCNNYAYSFSGIALSSRPGGSWHSLSTRGFEFEDAGYSMTRRSPMSFVAASRALMRRLDIIDQKRRLVLFRFTQPARSSDSTPSRSARPLFTSVLRTARQRLLSAHGRSSVSGRGETPRRSVEPSRTTHG